MTAGEVAAAELAMKTWAVRLCVGLMCAGVATVALLWLLPPASRLTYENIDKLRPSMGEAEVIELFGRPYSKGAVENGGRDIMWLEDQVLFGVRLDQAGKVVGIRWEKGAEPEGFWHKLRRRLRL